MVRNLRKSCTNAYLNRNAYGDSVWTHRDPADYSLVVYLNPIGYDLRKWGGETMFYNNDLTFVEVQFHQKELLHVYLKVRFHIKLQVCHGKRF